MKILDTLKQESSLEPIAHDPVALSLFPLIPYHDFSAALGEISTIARFHKMCRIVGHPGIGKTTLLLQYAQAHENAYYLCPTHGCRAKSLLRMMGEVMGYYLPHATIQSAVQDLIAFLNSRVYDSVFLIDECDTLCPKGNHIDNLDKLDILRYIWDYTKLRTAFIFAAPYDLEVRLQKSSEQISNSQFYRRCQIYQMQGMVKSDTKKFLAQVEREFHVRFDDIVVDELIKRIAAVERGGLGISIEILSNCLMAVLPQWEAYYKAIEAARPREEALHVFDSINEPVLIELPLLRKSMELLR